MADVVAFDPEDHVLGDEGRDVRHAFDPLGDRQQMDRGFRVVDVAGDLGAAPDQDFLVQGVDQVVRHADPAAEFDVLVAQGLECVPDHGFACLSAISMIESGSLIALNLQSLMVRLLIPLARSAIRSSWPLIRLSRENRSEVARHR